MRRNSSGRSAKVGLGKVGRRGSGLHVERSVGLQHRGARVGLHHQRASEHHGVLEIPEGSARPALGEQLDIIPNHVCATVNLVDELVAGDVSWPVSARGKNS